MILRMDAHRRALIRLAVADLYSRLKFSCSRRLDPVPVAHVAYAVIELRSMLAADDEAIVFPVFRHDEPGGTTTDPDTATLPDGVVGESLVPTDGVSGGVHDVARVFRDA